MPTAPRDGATSSAAGVSITFAASESDTAVTKLNTAEADADFAELGRVAAASSASRAGTAQQLMAEMAAVLEAPSGTVLEPEPEQPESMADSDSDEFDADPQSPRSDPADFLRERLAGELAPLALFSSAVCIRAAQPPLSCLPIFGISRSLGAVRLRAVRAREAPRPPITRAVS